MKLSIIALTAGLSLTPAVPSADSLDFLGIGQNRAMARVSVAFGGASRVVTAAENLLGRNPTHRRRNWCADGASVALMRAGKHPIPGSRARDALRAGPHIAGPVPGALAVWRGATHVGIVRKRRPDGMVEVISFNWGHSTRKHTVSPRQIMAWVMPR